MPGKSCNNSIGVCGGDSKSSAKLLSESSPRCSILLVGGFLAGDLAKRHRVTINCNKLHFFAPCRGGVARISARLLTDFADTAFVRILMLYLRAGSRFSLK